MPTPSPSPPPAAEQTITTSVEDVQTPSDIKGGKGDQVNPNDEKVLEVDFVILQVLDNETCTLKGQIFVHVCCVIVAHQHKKIKYQLFIEIFRRK